MHSVVAQAIFLATGAFVALPDALVNRAEEFWRERVFAMLLDTHKIDEQTAGSMRSWQHSGFSVDTLVRQGTLRELYPEPRNIALRAKIRCI